MWALVRSNYVGFFGFRPMGRSDAVLEDVLVDEVET